MYYCENLEDHIFIKLNEFRNLKNLKFRKGVNISSEAFTVCFANFQSRNLLQLDLTECQYINDDAMILLVKKNIDLENIKINWCSKLTEVSVYQIFLLCKNLKKIELQGHKLLTEKGFPQLDKLVKSFNMNNLANFRSSKEKKYEIQ